MDENPNKNSDLEIEKLSLEHEKVKLEREKLAVERYKARWTALSIAVPLLVAIITLGYTSYLENKRSEVAQDLQQKRDEAEFQLKAFEVLLSNPAQTNVKAAMLNALFSFKINSDVMKRLDDYGNQQYIFESKHNMFRTYANSNRTKEELVKAYNQLFPGNVVTANMLEQGGNVGVAAPPNNGEQRTHK